MSLAKNRYFYVIFHGSHMIFLIHLKTVKKDILTKSSK
jgi:hypothetical protein